MANELRHSDVGTALSKTEWEAVGSHVLNRQAAGDIIYASSTSQLSRLAIGSANQFLVTNAGGTDPAWTSSPAVATAITPDASDGATLGTAALEWSDLYLADAAVIYFGDDDDVTLTHVHNDGLLLSSTDQLQFGDSGTFIHQSSDGVLTIQSDTTVDINGAVALNGAITGATNITLSGELDAATLDISGNADIDGTLEADAYTVDGATLAEYIADTVGAMVSSNTESGITVAYQDADNTLDFTVGTLNQDTTGTAALASTVTVVDSTDTSSYIAMFDSATGDLAAKTDAGLTYNAGTGMLTATGFTGPLTGNASGTAATVTTAAQPNITSLGTLTTLTVDNIIINGTNIGHTSDTDAIAISSGGVVTMNQIPVFSAGINVSGGSIAGTIATASQTNITAVGTIATGVWQGTAIASGYIAGDAITGAKIADNAIDSEHYTDGSIDTVHIADDQITLAKMASGTDGQVITYDASGNPAAVGPGSDGQLLTSTGAGSPPAFEDAPASGGTITLNATEDLAAGDAVAIVSSGGESKVEKIRGATDNLVEILDSYDSMSLNANQLRLIYCSDVDKWARVFYGQSYYIGIQIGDYSAATHKITWGAAVMITSASAYPVGACWASGSIDRLVIVGGSGTSRGLSAHVYMVSGSGNTVVTADSGSEYAPGTAFVVTTNAAKTRGIALEWDSTEDTAVGVYCVDGGSDDREIYLFALTITGSSTNTAADNIADTKIIDSHQAAPAFAWNNYSTGAGLLVYTDDADNGYLRVMGFIHNNSAFTVSSEIENIPSADYPKSASMNQSNMNDQSLSADTSNGNFVMFLRTYDAGNNYITPQFLPIAVDYSNGVPSASATDGTSVISKMVDGVYSGFDFFATRLDSKGGFSEGANARYDVNTTATKNLISYGHGMIAYDPDIDCHVAILKGSMYKLYGEEEFMHWASGYTALIFTITLAGTNDLVATVYGNDFWMPIQRGGVNDGASGYDTSAAQALTYDTTNNLMLLQATLGSSQINGAASEPRDALIAFDNGSTKETKYARSNMNKFIGFATAAVDISSSASATITIKGGINEAMSGKFQGGNLALGTEYWVGDSGRLTDYKPLQSMYLYKAGIATATTKLLVMNDNITARV